MPDSSAFKELRLSARSLAAPPPRGARLPQWIGCAVDADAVLRSLKVVVVGCGSVGGRVAAHLARLQVRALWLVDPKAVKPTGLLTAEVHPSDLGKPKVAVLGRRCKALSPETRLFVFPGPVQDLPLAALADANLGFLATDNLLAEVAAGEHFVHLGVPLVHAAVHGPALLAQIKLFSNRDASTPCPACSFGPAEWGQLERQVQYSCEGAAADSAIPSPPEEPTMSISSLCSLAADLAIHQALRHVLKLGQSVADTLLEYCGFTNAILTSPLARHPACRCAHSVYAQPAVSKSLDACSLAEVLALARLSGAPGDAAFTVGDWVWVEAGACRCPQPAAVRRFVRAGRPFAGRCGVCRSPIRSQPFYTHRAVTAACLNGAVTKPLARLGARGVGWILVHRGDEGFLLRSPGCQPNVS